jgi:hypothetical protein
MNKDTVTIKANDSAIIEFNPIQNNKRGNESVAESKLKNLARTYQYSAKQNYLQELLGENFSFIDTTLSKARPAKNGIVLES